MQRSVQEAYMDKDSIDASIGLGFSLELFSRYKSNGILQAKLRRFPSIQGPVHVYLYLAEGTVVSSYVEDKDGQRFPASKEVLVRLDDEKGPFEWDFRSSPVAPVPPLVFAAPVPAIEARLQTGRPLSSLIPNAAVLKLVSSLPSEWLLSRTLQQRRRFFLVWQEIDGKRTVEDIKADLGISLPEAVIEEILKTLLKLNLIVIRD
jgi:hypothetical protein